MALYPRSALSGLSYTRSKQLGNFHTIDLSDGEGKKKTTEENCKSKTRECEEKEESGVRTETENVTTSSDTPKVPRPHIENHENTGQSICKRCKHALDGTGIRSNETEEKHDTTAVTVDDGQTVGTVGSGPEEVSTGTETSTSNNVSTTVAPPE